jgi:hypothetical protein
MIVASLLPLVRDELFDALDGVAHVHSLRIGEAPGIPSRGE